MDSGPYAPPKSVVKDVLPAAASYWLRTKWLYLAALAPFVWIAFLSGETLLQALTPIALASGLALAALLSAWPIHALATRRTDSLPWWWDVAWYGMLGTFVFGAIAEDAILMLVGFLSSTGLCVSLVIAVWLVEIRYSVRVFSKARSVVFVKRDNKPW